MSDLEEEVTAKADADFLAGSALGLRAVQTQMSLDPATQHVASETNLLRRAERRPLDINSSMCLTSLTSAEKETGALTTWWVTGVVALGKETGGPPPPRLRDGGL